MEDSKSEDLKASFQRIVRDFLHDIIRVYPERADTMAEDLKQIAVDGENVTECVERVRAHVLSYAPKHFFEILYENDSLFTSDDDVEFLPGLKMKELWSEEGVSDATKSTMWKYMQLILFNVVGDISDKDSFGDAASLFEAINEDELKSKLEETLGHMESLFEKSGDGEGSTEGGEEGKSHFPHDAPSAQEMHDHISSMLGGKLGALAKEIADDAAEELGLDDKLLGEDGNVNQVFKKLFQNPGKLISLVKRMGGKIDHKIKSGEIKESELLEEATQFMGKMKSMPGMENMQEMLKKMGMAGGASKAGMAAFQSHMNRNIKSAKTKERMQAKLQARKAAAAAAMSSSEPAAVVTEGSNGENQVFKVGDGAERTPRMPVQTSDTMNRMKKKKRRKPKASGGAKNESTTDN